MEFGYVSLTIFIAAAYFAMSASVPITDVPWVKFITYPSAFGGREALWRGIGWFSAWCILSIAFGITVAWLIKSSEPFITYLYHAAGRQEDAHAGLSTLLSLSLALYIGTVIRTRNLAELINRKIPFNMANAIGSFDYKTIISSYI